MAKPLAYYNEFDPHAAAVLRELIAEDLIAPGVVDERSIELVQPSDLRGFRQVHLFAGFGIWSLAARLAGWADDRPLWSASCPCPPFSSAGKTKSCPGCGRSKPIPDVRRTGAFLCSLCGCSWIADGRHLWPEVWRLVRDERPSCVMGEQVASADGRTWLDLVRASLEIVAYDAWGVDTCAAGFGAPHIRQRLYWLAEADGFGREWRGASEESDESGSLERPKRFRHVDGLGDAERARLERLAGNGDDRDEPGRIGAEPTRPAPETNLSSGLADAHGKLARETGTLQRGGEQRLASGNRGGSQGIDRAGPTNGLWRDADWLGCKDGRFRPVKPGTFPLVAARTFRNRVVALRGAGNAINVAQASEFIRAVMPELP